MKRYFADVWPKLVKRTPPTRDADRIKTVLARTQLYGAVMPELGQFFAPLVANEGPPLDDFIPGTWAPAPRRDVGNRAEALFIDAQSYRPLWAEIFLCAFEVGSTPSGDIWLVAFDPEVTNFVFSFLHDDETVEGPVARDLETFVSDREAEFTTDDDTVKFFESRSRWLVTLLTEANASDLEIRASFDFDANEPMTQELFELRAPSFSEFPPTAFYSCLAAYFGDDDALAITCAEAAKASGNPLVRDFGMLMLEFIDGTRRSLGIIENVPELRARVRSLKLWSPPEPLAPTPEDEVLATLFDEDGYRDEDAITEFIAKGDRALTNRLIERATVAATGRHAFLDVLIAWKETSAIDRLASLANEVDRFHLARHQLVQLIHAAGDARHAPILLGILKKFGAAANGDDSQLDAMIARTILTLADLKVTAAIPAISKFIDSPSTELMGVRDAALFAVAELGAKDVLASLLPRIQSDELYGSAGLRWAAGRLAALSDEATRSAILERLESVRIHHRTISDEDDTEHERSIASLFNPELGGQEEDVAAEIALEHSRVILGCSNEALVELLEAALKSDMDAPVLAWALLAARSQPGLVNTDSLRAHSNQLVRHLTSSKR